MELNLTSKISYDDVLSIKINEKTIDIFLSSTIADEKRQARLKKDDFKKVLLALLNGGFGWGFELKDLGFDWSDGGQNVEVCLNSGLLEISLYYDFGNDTKENLSHTFRFSKPSFENIAKQILETI